MIEVKLQLYDKEEVAAVTHLMNQIAERRQAMMEQMTRQAQGTPPETEPAIVTATKEDAERGSVTVIAQGGGQSVPDNETIVQAASRYATEQGLPALQALLDKVGVKKVSEVPKERHAEFIGWTRGV